jgi:hypothetical protein
MAALDSSQQGTSPMRIILAGAACAIIVSLGGCGPGSAFDNGVREQFKTSNVESCVAAARGTPAAGQLDFPRLCNCAVDRYMAGKTTDELRNANPQDPALRAASEQCALEQLGGAAGAGRAPAGEAGANEAGEAQPTE